MEEGARGVDELADGRGRGAGDEPEDLLRADPANRRAWDPRGPLSSGRRGAILIPRGRRRGGGGCGRGVGTGSGAHEQGEADASALCPCLRREEPVGTRGGFGCGESEGVERAEVEGGHRWLDRRGEQAGRGGGSGLASLGRIAAATTQQVPPETGPEAKFC